MFVKALKIKNFRNHGETRLDFKSRLVFFIGDNGEGKTNIIEAIHLFSTLKSFRDNPDDEMLGWEKDYYFLKLDFAADETDKSIEIGYSRAENLKKKIKLNNEVIHKKADIIGELKCVVFSPVDMKIIEGGPSERRRFIDSFISTVNRSYLNNILSYNKILKQRNTLLKKKGVTKFELMPWDKLLIERGKEITLARRDVLLLLNDLYKESLNKLSGNKDNFEIKYFPNVEDINEYQSKMESRFEKDLRLGYTTTGIHRDDIFVGKDGKDIQEFGSQGQKRSTVISLKTALFKYIQMKEGESPILLIDDVIRELDVKRREYFVNLIIDCGQAFFTTTDLEGIVDYIGNLEDKKQIFRIKSGTVEEIEDGLREN